MNVSFPIEIGTGGGVHTVEDSLFSRLRVMFRFIPGQRLMRPDYGINLHPVEQTTHDTDEVLTATLITARENISRYLGDAVVTTVAIERDASSRRIMKIHLLLVPVTTVTVKKVTIELPVVS